MSKIISKSLQRVIDDPSAGLFGSAQQEGAVGFMARAFIMATMPHKAVAGTEFKRSNGHYRLAMLAPSDIGLPYGSIPRLMLAWMTTEVQRKDERKLVLGSSLGTFIRALGLASTSGRWGTKARVRDQLRRLLSCTIHGSWQTETADVGCTRTIAEEYKLWWDPKTEEQCSIWESTIILSEPFFRELREHPVPISLLALARLQKSPLALDIYTWLTYRMSYLNKMQLIPWPSLQEQFGAGYATDPHGQRNFRQAFKRELGKVLFVYPVRLEASANGLILWPNPTHVPRLPKQ